MAKFRKDLDDAPPKPKSDAYTGILILSLVAQIAAATFLFLDYNQYPTTKPKPVPERPPAASAPAPAAPAPAPVAAPPGPGKAAPK